MPTIKEKPSLHTKHAKGLSLDELIKAHPLADEDHLKKEFERINPTKKASKPLEIPKEKVTL